MHLPISFKILTIRDNKIMNSTSLDAGSGTINEQPSLPQISLDSGGAINEQPSLTQIPNTSTKPKNDQPNTIHTLGFRTTNPSLAPPTVPPTAEKDQFSCAEILAGMQVAKEDESTQPQQQQPRKRGRPRMNPINAPKVKRPRGRPRKDGKPPVQRKAAEMLLMLYKQGPNSSVDQPRKYRKVINIGGVNAVASGANMTTRQGSRHGKKSDNKGSDKGGGVVIDTNTTKVFKGISTAQQEAVSLLVTGRRNIQLQAPAPLPSSQPGSLSYKTATVNDLPPLQGQRRPPAQKAEGRAVMRKSKIVDSVTNSTAAQLRISRAIQAINNRYGPPGAERNKKLADVTARGITLRPSQKWQAQLYYARKSRYIGVFDTREEAALAYEVAREILKTQDRCGMDLGAHHADDDAEKIKEEIDLARKAAAFAIMPRKNTPRLLMHYGD